MRAAPIGVYVHWPYCARICPYCDFNVYRDRGGAGARRALVVAIADDLRAHAALTGPRALASIFFGGGTPSLMEPDAVAELIALAGRLWTPEPDIEIALEANPTDAEAARFAAFADAGVARLSLGVQALDDASLAFLGRDHDAHAARRAATLAAKVFPRLSLDLIYALPEQSVAGWTQTLRQALTLGAEHLSPYALTIEPRTAFERAVRRGRLIPVDDARGADLYDATARVLEAAGFDAYEVSNHARGAAARARHNLVYWRGWDYVGVGPGAHGRLTLDGARLATVAARTPADYAAAVACEGVGWSERETLAPRAIAEERLLMGLRLDEGVAFDDLTPLGLTARHPRVREGVDDGWLTASPDRLAATRAGRRLLDRLIAALA